MKKHISHSNNLKNLNLIINSDTYKLAHEDIGLLSRNEMRGVRMLLEITKPDLILEENKILSTIIIFGGASITEESNTCLLYTSPSPRDRQKSRMPSSA